MDNYLDLLKLILPEFLIHHFDLVKNTKNGEVMHLYFEEQNSTPKEESSRSLIAHGFHKEVTIQDFPLRGNPVYLHVKRRRWLDKTNQRSCTKRLEPSCTGNTYDHGVRCFFKRN